MELDVKNQYWMGKIPDSWETKKIKFVLSQRNENNVPIKSTEILSLTAKQGVIPYSEKEGGGNKPKQDFSAYKLTYPGDIVMNSMNILSGAVGLSKYMGCISPVYYALKPKNKTDDVRFFYYVFANKTFQNSLLGLGNGILIKQSDNGNFNTIRMRIPIEKLNNLSVPYPSPSIQKKIADFLDRKTTEIDGLIDNINAEIDTIQQYQRSVITRAVTKGLDSNVPMKDSGIEWIGEIPASWKVARGKNILKLLSRKVEPDYEIITAFRDGQVTLRKNRRTEGFTISTKEIGYQGVKANDLVVHAMDGFAGAIGISDADGKASPVLNVLDSNQNKRYVMYYLRVCALLGVFQALAKGIRIRTADTRWDTLKNLNYLLPSKSEQQKIVDYLDQKVSQIQKVIKSKQQQINQLIEYKNSLIFEYVTGKEQVKEAN